MFLLFNRWNLIPFFAVETPTPSAGAGDKTPSGEMGKEDMIEFLGDDEDDQETIDLTKDKSKDKDDKTPLKSDETDDEEEIPEESEEEEEDELADLEAELEEPTDDQLELVTPVRRREILAKYPTIFKDFPYLEKAYYREQQFTELLPTIEDAKQAVQAKDTLDRFESDLMSGNAETILKVVKQQDPNAFYKIADNYLTTLRNVDEKAYYNVLGNTIKHTVAAMAQEARARDNKELMQAAHILNQFVFQSSNFEPPTSLSKQENPEDKSKENAIKEREQSFVRQQFETARGSLNTKVNNTLRNTIAAHIDPRQSMTDYVRRNAERDAMENLEVLMERDVRFKSILDKLWEKTFKDGFSQDAQDRIKSACLSKAKTLLPAVIKKARNDALRGMGKRVVDDSDTPIKGDKKGPIKSGQPRSQTPNTGKIKEAKDIPRGMKTIDFLMSD